MKRIFGTVLFSLFLLSLSAQQAKYVFFFIGDGMGLNHVNGTEMYLACCENRIGRTPLLFTSFPYGGIVTTYSKSNPITDSAAAGTALATGTKTRNGVIGMDSAQIVPLHNLAEKAARSNHGVGIISSVSIDHATPAVFYSHKPLRSSYYEIGSELPLSGFDFFAGAGLLQIVNKEISSENLLDKITAKGYTILRGNEEYASHHKEADKIVWLQSEGYSPHSLPFALDRKEGDMTLPDMTENGIRFLANKCRDKGFFMMIEGGQIDWAAHSNDAATVFGEVIDFDQAIRKAYDFYLAKPDSTLIIVTADHETGGLNLGTRRYILPLDLLKNQRVSQAILSRKVVNLFDAEHQKGTQPTWEQVRELLQENLGFWDKVELEEKHEALLKATYQDMIANKEPAKVKSEYFVDDKLAKVAVGILNEIVKLSWGTPTHTAAYVPLFAIGVGAENFTGLIDNTEIPKRLEKVAGY